jgi:hypothetical protein
MTKLQPAVERAQARLREQAELHLRLAAMNQLRRDHPGATSAPHRPSGGAFWRFVFVPLYRRVPWEQKERAMHALGMTAESHGWTPPAREPSEPWHPPAVPPAS